MDFSALWVPKRSGEAEWIDSPDTPWDEVLRAMQDVARINALLLTTPILIAALRRHVRLPEGRPLRVLDVATGLADIPIALVEWARARGCAIEVVGLDLNARILAMAESRVAAYPEIELVEGDALAMPFAPSSFDAALCHLALHHFPLEAHVAFFRELDRVIRPGGALLVGDLERSRLNYAIARPFLSLVASPVAKRDGLVSILNALSGAELDDLLERTGLAYLHRERIAPPSQFLVAGSKP